jgi:hypothetical protein
VAWASVRECPSTGRGSWLKKGNGPGLAPYHVVVVAATSGGACLSAVRHGFSNGWLSFACLMSVLGAIGIVSRLLRL